MALFPVKESTTIFISPIEVSMNMGHLGIYIFMVVVFIPTVLSLNISSDFSRQLIQTHDEQIAKLCNLTESLDKRVIELHQENLVLKGNLTVMAQTIKLHEKIHSNLSGTQLHQFSILQQDNVQLKGRLTNLESEKENLYSNLTYLTKDNKELLLTVSAYNKTLMNQNQTILFLSQTLAEVNKRIEGWASFMTSTKQDAVAVRDDLIYINNEILTLENRTEKTYQLLTEQKFIVAALSNKLRVIREFTVQNTNGIGNLHQHQVVVFDQVTTNEGERYNAQTGTFTADINGWYVFFFDIRVSHVDKLCLSELVENNAAVVLTYALSGVRPHEHKSESNMAVLHVQVGDHTWVRSSPVGEQSCAIDDHSSFSGFLMNSD